VTTGATAADRHILNQEPFSSIVEHVVAMALAVENTTGKRGIARISITPDLGSRIGLLPAHSLDIATPVGVVELYVEAAPRFCGIASIPQETP
jgi:hypothetical protein